MLPRNTSGAAILAVADADVRDSDRRRRPVERARGEARAAQARLRRGSASAMKFAESVPREARSAAATRQRSVYAQQSSVIYQVSRYANVTICVHCRLSTDADASAYILGRVLPRCCWRASLRHAVTHGEIAT